MRESNSVLLNSTPLCYPLLYPDPPRFWFWTNAFTSINCIQEYLSNRISFAGSLMESFFVRDVRLNLVSYGMFVQRCPKNLAYITTNDETAFCSETIRQTKRKKTTKNSTETCWQNNTFLSEN